MIIGGPEGTHLFIFFVAVAVAVVEEIEEVPRGGAWRRGLVLRRLVVVGDVSVQRGGLTLLENSPEQPGGHAYGELGRGLGFGVELGWSGERILRWRLPRRVLPFPDPKGNCLVYRRGARTTFLDIDGPNEEASC